MEYKCTVPFVVSYISSNCVACFVEKSNIHAVQRHVLVVRVCIGFIVVVREFEIFVTNDTIDNRFFFFVTEFEIVVDTISITITFKVAHIAVHVTMTGTLISVEITFGQETGTTVFDYTKITCVFNIGGCCVGCRNKF